MALGADMIEFDVRRTKDNVYVVHHDHSIQGKPIKEFTYEKVGKMARKEGFAIPKVEDVLKWARRRIKLDVELKEEGYEKEIVALILKYIKKDQFVITSFSDSSLKTIKEKHPDVKVGLLLGKPRAPLWARISEFFPVKKYKKAKADFLVAHWRLLRAGFLERAQKSRKPVIVWTVNDQKMMERLFQDRRVYAIITDQLDLAVTLQEKM